MRKYPPVPTSAFYAYVESLKKDENKLFKEQFEACNTATINY